MLSYLKMSFLILTCSAFVACNSSKEEKAKKNADGIVAQYNALVNDLNGAVPNASWSEAQLNTYENKLDRLEQLESSMDNIDGKHGVMIIGGDNTYFVAERRRLISQARSSKKQMDQQLDTQESTLAIVEKIQDLGDEMQDIESERYMLGDLSSSWSYKKLVQYKDLTSKLHAAANEALDLIDQLPYSSHKSTLITSMNTIKEMTETDLEDVQQLLDEKVVYERENHR